MEKHQKHKCYHMLIYYKYFIFICFFEEGRKSAFFTFAIFMSLGSVQKLISELKEQAVSSGIYQNYIDGAEVLNEITCLSPSSLGHDSHIMV